MKLKCIHLVVLLFFVQCSTTSEVESNKELFRYFVEEMLAKGNLSEYKQRRTPDFVCHAPDGDFNLDQDYLNAIEVQKAMKGFKITIIKSMAEKDMVAVHWQAANDKEIGTGIIWFRVYKGKLAEEWPSLPYFKRK